jgi:hypothetical protein
MRSRIVEIQETIATKEGTIVELRARIATL